MTNRDLQSQQHRTDMEESRRERPAIFFYPEFNNPFYVMDMDDLMDDACLVLCTHDQKAYIWVGYEFEEDPDIVSLRYYSQDFNPFR